MSGHGKTSSVRMPSIFIGHGSPMNALGSNAFTEVLKLLGERLPKPDAILCVSAHWMTEGTWVTQMEAPPTVHDFHGFPQVLFDVRYPAPGAPHLASLIQSCAPGFRIQTDSHGWGLDHGTWSVLKHLYPKADVPVLQLSLDMTQKASYHFSLGQELSKLRDQGIMLVGSGNIVHNLRQLRWEANARPHAWAIDFDGWMKEKILARDYHALQFEFLESEAGRLSNPTLEHYYPVLYTLGAGKEEESLEFFYEGIENASLSMLSFRIG